MTADQIALDVYRRLDYADTPPPSVVSRILGFINTQYVRLLSTDRMRPLRETSATIVTLPGQAVYALPVPCARIQRVTDLSSQYELGSKPLEWYRTNNPGAITTGTPCTWVPHGFAAAAHPVGPGVKTLTASGGPTTSTFVVRALLEGGVITESLPFNLHSTTPLARVTVPLPFDVLNRDILDVISFMATGPIGNVTYLPTLWGLASTTRLAQIARTEYWSRYYTLALDPTPSASLTYSVDFEQEAQVIGGLEEPWLLPPEFHDLLALLARVDEYEFKSDDRWTPAKMQAAQRVMELRQYVDNHDVYKRTALPEQHGYWWRDRCGPLIGGIPTTTPLPEPPIEPVEPIPEDTYMQLIFDGIAHARTAPGVKVNSNWIPVSVPVKIVSVNAIVSTEVPASPTAFNLKHTESGAFVFGTSDVATWPTFAALTSVRTLIPDDPDVVYPAGTSFQVHTNMPAAMANDLAGVVISLNVQPQ